jgi:membrane protein YdbS with pleckstrin-like domain
MAAPAYPADKGGEIVVEFDQLRGPRYAVCWSCVCCPLITSCLSLPCQPCLCYCAVKEFRSQRCTVDDRRIHFQSGWVNKSEKTIPLDRVQDLAIQEGLMQRMCGVSSVLIQTAGSSGSDGAQAEAVLQSVKDARRLRARIIERRDMIVLGRPGAPAPSSAAAGGGIDFVAQTPITQQPDAAATMALVNEVRALRESVARIEKHVEAVAERR